MVVTNWLRMLSRRLQAVRSRRNPGRKRRLPRSLTRSIEALEDRTLLAAAWVNIGPFSATGGQSNNAAPDDRISGAAHVVLPHPTNANILYAGMVNGGVARTFNATDPTPTWESLTDDMPSNSIGSLVFDNADLTRQTLYAGNARVSSFARVGIDSVGLLKTTDGGANWTVVNGGGTLTGKSIVGIVANGNTITVAVEGSTQGGNNNRGIFRSTDGGTTFNQVGAAGGLPTGMCFDLVQVPADPNTMYTSFTNGSAVGIYKSINGGAAWTKVSNAAIDGLLGNSTNNVEFAAGAFNNVFAAILNSSSVAGFFRSGDGGATWTQMDLPGSNETGGFQGLTGFNLHFSIAADPNNADIVYVGGGSNANGNSLGSQGFSGRLFRGNAASAAGSQWVHLTDSNTQGPAGGGTANRTAPHADSRDLAFDANGHLIEGDDGGVYRRTSPQNNTGDWFTINGDLCAIEAHDVAYDSVSNTVITGNQDNGTTFQPTSGATTWEVFTGGDGGDVLVDDVSLAGSGQSIRYSSFQNLGFFLRSTWDATGNFVSFVNPAMTLTGGGAAFQPFFSTPLGLNVINPQRLIFQGSNGLYESTNQGNTISAIGATAGVTSLLQDAIVAGGRQNGADNENVLWVGAGSDVYFRSAAGNVAATAADPTTQLVRDLTVDPDDFAIAFIVDQNQVFRTSNSGAAWTDVTGNLMTLASEIYSINYIATTTVDAIIVGTNNGVYVASTLAPDVWVKMGNDALPNVIIDELDYDAADDVLIVGTFGRGAWRMNGVTTEVINLVGPARLNIAVNSVIVGENGQTLTATVTRNGPLAAALTVNLVSSDTTEASVPASVVIQAGQASATFTITGVDDLIPDGTQPVTITASSAGFADGTVDITVIDNETAALTLNITATSMQENGGSSLVTVTRNSGTVGDLVVTLTSGDTTEVGVPATVTIRDGQSSATFALFAVDDLIADGTQTVTVTASASGHMNGTDTINVLDNEALTLTISPITITEQGGIAIGTITRNIGTSGNLVITLTSSDTTEATVPATVTILNGQSSATFQIRAVDDALADGNQPVTITAGNPAIGFKTAQLTVIDNEVPTVTLSINPTQISEAGGVAIGTVTRNTPAVGNMVVMLTNSDPSEVTIPATVTIPDGSFSATFLITAINDTLEDPIQTVTITAAVPNFVSGVDTVDVIDDDAIRINGTNGGDRFVFYAGEPGRSHIIVVNGVRTVLAPTIRIVRFFGYGGNDTLQAFGTLGADTVTLSPGAALFTGPGFTMSSNLVETTTVDGRGGANGNALFFDSAGIDTFTTDPLQGVMRGTGYSNTAYSFGSVVGYSTAGGADLLVIRDSAGADSYFADAVRAILTGTNFRTVAYQFERTFSDALRGGVDIAQLNDTAGNETFSATGQQAALTGIGLNASVRGYDKISAFATAGTDAAVLNGSSGNDTFVGRDRVGTLAGLGFETNAFGFDRVTANAGTGTDAAYLYDSSGADVFSGIGTSAALQGTGFLNTAVGFDSVTIFGYFGLNRKNVSNPRYIFREFGTWV